MTTTHDENTQRFPIVVLTKDRQVAKIYPKQIAGEANEAHEHAVKIGGYVAPTRGIDAARVIARQVCWLRDNGAASMLRTDGVVVFANGDVSYAPPVTAGHPATL